MLADVEMLHVAGKLPSPLMAPRRAAPWTPGRKGRRAGGAGGARAGEGEAQARVETPCHGGREKRVTRIVMAFAMAFAMAMALAG